jgi:hypothetical protein
VYVLWRSIVLSGVGGYDTPYSLLGRLQLAVRGFAGYFAGLFAPMTLLDQIVSPQPSTLAQLAALAATGLFAAALIVYRRRLLGLVHGETSAGRRVTAGLLLFGAAATATCLLISPLLAGLFNSLGQWIVTDFPGVLTQTPNIPPGYLFELIRDFALSTLVTLLIFCIAGLVCLKQRQAVWRSFSTTREGRGVVLLLVWLTAPLALYTVTSATAPRLWYIATVPACLILAFALARALRFAQAADRTSPMFSQQTLVVGALVFVSALSITSTFAADYAPLERASTVADDFFSAFDGIVSTLPPGAHLRLTDVPALPSVKSLSSYGIDSWLDLHYPTNSFTVELESYRYFMSADLPTSLRLDVDQQGSEIWIKVE